ALEHATAAAPYMMAGMGSDYVTLHNFYDSLSCLAQYSQLAATEQSEIMARVKQNQTSMQQWAEQAPMNYRHRWELVEAECYHIQGMRSQAMEAYDQAIQTATENDYPHEAALAHELAAKFYLDWGKEKVASGYMQEAYYGYAHWGAHAKVAHLEQIYPNLLAVMLASQQNRQSTLDHSSGAMATLATTSVSSEQMRVDLLALIKASQAISQEIEWEQLLNTLMQNAVATAGAQMAQLILSTDDIWTVVAKADGHCTQLCQMPLSEAIDLPQSVIRRVLRTQETALYDNLSANTEFSNDAYVLENQPKSVFCSILTQQREPIGALYLENSLSVGAFTQDRIETVKLLMSQATISLEISKLYRQHEDYSQTLEVEVAHKTEALQKKTQDLEQTLDLLKETNHALIRTTKLKDEFLANMSHELRTPLNAILGLTEALQEEIFGVINPKQKKALTTVSQSGTHLLTLINDILDLAKIESGKIDLEYASAPIEKICTTSLEFIRQQAYQKQIQLNVQISPKLSVLCVDERRIHQVLINLLNNAVKFTPAGGSVTLKVAPSHDFTEQNSEETSLMGAPSDPNHIQWIRFVVIDTGIGIKQKDMQRLFQSFVQIDSALNRQYAGTGLGLSLVKRIVELHGGKVGVSSQVGVGSQFWFDLPCEDMAVAAVSDAIAGATPKSSVAVLKAPIPAYRILLAEDSQTNIETVSVYLEAKGYGMILAQDGETTIELTQTEQPDAILMDIQMPRMDGLEAIRRIRKIPGCENLPIIALTAMAMRGDREKCLEAGATEYLSKPIELKQLVKTIQQCLER
ncbi:MAG: response regulator, partial [Leptolyngbya sp. SIO1D8]|nr:response regulator [Leptolyngbya sp. SIO1D8]